MLAARSITGRAGLPGRALLRPLCVALAASMCKPRHAVIVAPPQHGQDEDEEVDENENENVDSSLGGPSVPYVARAVALTGLIADLASARGINAQHNCFNLFRTPSRFLARSLTLAFSTQALSLL